MNSIFEGPQVAASTNVDARAIMCKAIVDAKEALKDREDSFHESLERLLALLRDASMRVPEFTQVHHPDLQCQALLIKWEDFDQACPINCVFRLTMPCHDSELLWMPWLPQQQQPRSSSSELYFHPITIAGRQVLQARGTKCYDHTYRYSGQTHPLEAGATPPEITQLYHHVNAMFGLPQDGIGGANACLVNEYPNGRLFISEHSDDERAFGAIHDVFCFVTGPASRPGIFRVRKSTGRNGPKRQKAAQEALHQLCGDPTRPTQTRELFRLRIPAGLYVMRGREFQQRYTHEFPQVHERLFRRLCSAEPGLPKHKQGSLLPGFPLQLEADSSSEEEEDRPPPQKSLGVVQAEWIQAHRERVLELLRNGSLRSVGKWNQKQTTPEQDCADFQEWCQGRTSYTLRNFQVTEAAAAEKEDAEKGNAETTSRRAAKKAKN